MDKFLYEHEFSFLWYNHLREIWVAVTEIWVVLAEIWVVARGLRGKQFNTGCVIFKIILQ